MTRRLIALAVFVVLAACQTTGSAGNPALVKSCTAASGYTARAQAARDAGAEGDIQATQAELASVNACVRRQMPAASGPRQCNLQLVGGVGYACLQP
ncbi:MAG: hypothetical protein V4712_07415 [Pseudomonadota bacterium]